jgi:hypothetical protein
MRGSYNILVPDPKFAWIIQWIFELRDTRGWGGHKIAKALNKDPRIASLGMHFYPCTVDYFLENEIYGGTYVFGETNADIFNDTRVVRPVENPEEILVVHEFCEPLVPKERYGRVRASINTRKAARATRKAAKEQGQGKLIKALTPGISLVHPLAGLVCCGHCSAAMNAKTSGRASKTGTK